MPLQECMQKHSSTDFLKWRYWFLHEWPNLFRPEIEYLIQIAAEIGRIREMLSKYPKAIDLKAYKLKFQVKKPKDDEPEGVAEFQENEDFEMSYEEKQRLAEQEYIAKSKQHLAMIIHCRPDQVGKLKCPDKPR